MRTLFSKILLLHEPISLSHLQTIEPRVNQSSLNPRPKTSLSNPAHQYPPKIPDPPLPLHHLPHLAFLPPIRPSKNPPTLPARKQVIPLPRNPSPSIHSAALKKTRMLQSCMTSRVRSSEKRGFARERDTHGQIFM